MNYPNAIKKDTKNIKLDSKLSHKNRGMTLENEINASNEYYREIDKAIIYKKPTPVKIVKVDYPSRDKAIIKVFIKVNILTLKQRKLIVKHLLSYQIFILIK